MITDEQLEISEHPGFNKKLTLILTTGIRYTVASELSLFDADPNARAYLEAMMKRKIRNFIYGEEIKELREIAREIIHLESERRIHQLDLNPMRLSHRVLKLATAMEYGPT